MESTSATMEMHCYGIMLRAQKPTTNRNLRRNLFGSPLHLFTLGKYGELRFTFARLRWCLCITTRAATRHPVKKTRRSHGDYRNGRHARD